MSLFYVPTCRPQTLRSQVVWAINDPGPPVQLRASWTPPSPAGLVYDQVVVYLHRLSYNAFQLARPYNRYEFRFEDDTDDV